MNKHFGSANWRDYIPTPVCEDHPEYFEFYSKAWELAFDHVKDVKGMPQTPYMDEAFCESQIWIWDTCFMSLFCKYANEVFPGVESFDNFYGPLYEGKSLGKIIPSENEPEWTNSIHGQEREIDIHIPDNPPLFAWAEYENVLFSGDKERIKHLLYDRKVLQKHYDWIENLHESKKIDKVLHPNHLIAEKDGYKWEGGHSGMDNTPRGRIGEHATEARPNNPNMLWLDAICQQALAAKMISNLFELMGDDEQKELWLKKYEEKKNKVNSLYWDEKDKFYYDIDCNTHDFYKVMTIASYWTLTTGIATEERAEALAKEVENPKTMGGFVPLVSLSRSDNDYMPSGNYWRGSVWLPTAYAALKGLSLYNFYDITHKSALTLLEHMYKTYTNYEPHTIWEAYSPEKFEPATEVDDITSARKDFCGWSALGPIAVYIEFVLGFHTINAFEKTVKWAKPDTFKKKFGIQNLHFGDITTDIIADGNTCTVTSNEEYTLEINGTAYKINKGETVINL